MSFKVYKKDYISIVFCKSLVREMPLIEAGSLLILPHP